MLKMRADEGSDKSLKNGMGGGRALNLPKNLRRDNDALALMDNISLDVDITL